MTTPGYLCPDKLVPLLSLGDVPLANALVRESDLATCDRRYPLTLAFCPSLALVQLVERIPPETLFHDYPYFSSVADGVLANAKRLVDRLVPSRGLGPASQAIEIASNDGYLLQFYKAQGIPVLGVEPAANIARVAERERGIPTLVAFFDEAAAGRLAAEGRHADVIHANNVLAHVPDPVDLLKGVSRLLKPDGIAVVEAPYVKDMLDKVEFDTIYHEHIFYYSLTSFGRLCARAGLAVIDVERLSIHGGSLRYFLGHAGCTPASRAVTALLDQEQVWGVENAATYLSFVDKVAAVKRDLVRYLTDAKKAGRKLAAYGASAKGTTLLNYCGIDGGLIDFVVDRSPHKQGLYTPGTRLKIRPPETLLSEQPDEVLLLAWNFADEILAQQAEYRRRGGKFIVPVPRVAVV